jgi:predicted ribosome quality control (RQC) complex YloA/Tae2 family protein
MKKENIEITSNSIYYISKILQKELELGYINSVQNIDYNTIKMKIHRKQTKTLIINLDLLYLSNYNLIAMEQSTAFIKFLKKKLDNQRINEIKQNKNNKLIYFKLDIYYLIFEFFSKSNVILTDLDFKIISARRYEKWKDRSILRNETYLFPSSQDIKNENFENFKKLIDNQNKKDIIYAIIKNYNVAPYYLKTIFDEYEDKVSLENLETIFLKIKNLFEYEFSNLEIKNKNSKKLIVSNKINSEIKDHFSEIENTYLDSKKQENVSPENKKRKKLENILNIQHNTKEKFLTQIEDSKKQGESIYCNFKIIEDINKQVNIATLKKIDSKEIITKINTYFFKNNIKLKIKKLDLKNKTYQLELEN